MKRPGDPDLLWRYYGERRNNQETLALLVDRAATVVRKAEAEHRGPGELTPEEREQVDGLLSRASRLAEKLRSSN